MSVSARERRRATQQICETNPMSNRKSELMHRSFGYSISLTSRRDRRSNSWTRRRSSITSRLRCPCLSAFLLPRSAPDPAPPPCIRHRMVPLTAGDLHGPPALVRAPQRGLASIGAVLRGWSPVISLKALLAPQSVRSRSEYVPPRDGQPRRWDAAGAEQVAAL